MVMQNPLAFPKDQVAVVDGEVNADFLSHDNYIWNDLILLLLFHPSLHIGEKILINLDFFLDSLLFLILVAPIIPSLIENT